MKQFISFGLLFLVALPGFSQIKLFENNGFDRKGELYIHWGYNRSAYTKSDIQFKGDGYDFKLEGVKASDRQSPMDLELYLGPTSFTIPQYDFSIGYFIQKGLCLSFNIDHMKYVVNQNQVVKMSGYIQESNTIHDGFYDNQDKTITGDFLTFEHTDGLNYVNFVLDKYLQLFSTQSNSLNCSVLGGLGAGFLYPKSNVRLFGEGADKFHLTGYGFAGDFGLDLRFFKWIILQGQIKAGYINMPDITTHGPSRSNRAKQSFWFFQGMVLIGLNIPLSDFCSRTTNTEITQ